MRLPLFIFMLFVFSCAAKKDNEKTLENLTLQSKDTIRNVKTGLQKDSLNTIDKNKLRQGKWEYTVNGVKKGIVHYKNDKLNGYFKYRYYGDTLEGNYQMGKVHGLQFLYAPKQDSLALCVQMFDKDSLLWSGFPAADYLIDKNFTIKGFIISKPDSIYIKCPFKYQGKLFYEGMFYNRKPLEIHKIYYPNGQIKFINNYSERTFKKYTKNGQIIEDRQF